MKTAGLLKIRNSDVDYACGNCYTVLYGEREECPICGRYADPVIARTISQAELLALALNRASLLPA